MKSQEKSYFDSFREVVKAVNSTLDRQEVLDLLVNNVTQVMDLKASAEEANLGAGSFPWLEQYIP